MQIPFNRPYLTGKEKDYIEDALQRRELSGDGYYTQKVTEFLKKKFSLGKVLMTTSGTHALEMAADLIGLEEGDEVIMPSFTFPSTANAVLRRGARPIFAEIKETTLNIDPSDLEHRITKRTKAIIPVHYAGQGCDLDAILSLADKYNLYIIEDAAQGVNATYKGRYLGGIGHFGCYSFHGSKNYISGEGGALVINHCSKLIQDRAEIIREKGTNRARFIKGEVDKYTWIDQGSSYSPSEVLMALLYPQLLKMDQIKELREKIYNRYYRSLQQFLATSYLDYLSFPQADRDSNYHIFYITFRQREIRDLVLHQLQQRGIGATFHYIPLHSSPMGQKLGYIGKDLPITRDVTSRILRLPLYPDLSEQQLDYIIENIIDIFKGL